MFSSPMKKQNCTLNTIVELAQVAQDCFIAQWSYPWLAFCRNLYLPHIGFPKVTVTKDCQVLSITANDDRLSRML